MDYRDNPQHRVPHHIKWTSFAPPGWTNFAPTLTALNMKSHGGTFGYQLVSHVANSLKDFLEGRTKLVDLASTVVQMHVDTMSVIFQQDIKGDGGEIGHQLLVDLKKLVEKAAA